MDIARPKLTHARWTHARSTHAWACTLLALASTAGLGCPSSGSSDAGPYRDTEGADGEDAPLPCNGDVIFGGVPTEPLEVGTLRDGAFTAWANGQDVPFVWGLQGGTMIVPTLRATSAINRPGNQCVIVEIQNLEPMGGTLFSGFRTFRLRTDARREEDQFLVAELFDQLGTMEFPTGTPLTVDVTLRGSRSAAHARLDLRVIPSGAPIPAHCEALPTTGSGCRYREIPATGRITAIRPATPSDAPACPAMTSAAMTVEYELSIDAAYRDCTTAETRTFTLDIESYSVPEACLSANNLALGSTFAATYSDSFAGTCVPFRVTPQAFGMQPCTTQCVP